MLLLLAAESLAPVPPNWFYAAVSGGSVAGTLFLLFNRLRQSSIDAASQRKLTLDELGTARTELTDAWKAVDTERDKRRTIEHDLISTRNAYEMATDLLRNCETETTALRSELAGYRVETANYRAEVAELRRIMTVRSVEGEHLAGRNNTAPDEAPPVGEDHP